MSDGRMLDNKGKSKSIVDALGRQNPIFHQKLGEGPAPPNQPERRSPVATEQSPSDVFHQEASIPSRLLTPEAQGQTITHREGQSSDRQEVGSQEHTVAETSAAWWKESRVKTNPARRGETEK